MKSLFIGLLTSLLTLSNINIANASTPPMQLSIEDISTSNMYSINHNVLTDGRMFEEMSYTMMTDSMMRTNTLANSIWWSGSEGMITMDLGNQFMIEEILIQVDAHDRYQMDYSMDNISWSSLFTINPTDGDALYAMDTMSSDNLNEEFVASMDFSMVEARYLKISASGGDETYFVSEVQVFGSLPTIESSLIESQTVSPVPAPPSVMLFGAGLMMLMGLQYRRKRQLNRTLST